MAKIIWNQFTIKSQMGKNLTVSMRGYNEKNEALMLLQAIARMPREGKTPISIKAAYDAMLIYAGGPVFKGVEGSGKNAARLLNQGFVATATKLGFYIELTGDEFETDGLAA